jgi:hypothetical protein
MVKRSFYVFFLFCLCALCASAQIEITLNRSFVDSFADRVTIDSTFRVDVISKVHPASQDGDIHVAGTSAATGMITVAEVMNAKTERSKAVQSLMEAAGSGKEIPISGAWRIWSEHGGGQTYIQGEDVPPVTNSGAAHVFEIHPITKVAGEDVTHTWAPISGYVYKEAGQAFHEYERTNSEITTSADTITISTELAGYNYTQFVAKLLGEPFRLEGGTGVMAAIYDEKGDLLVNERRLVVASGTPPEQALRGMHKGQAVEVVGIPRISLKLVKWRVDNQQDPRCKQHCLTWNLPYEIIVAAITNEHPSLSD